MNYKEKIKNNPDFTLENDPEYDDFISGMQDLLYNDVVTIKELNIVINKLVKKYCKKD